MRAATAIAALLAALLPAQGAHAAVQGTLTVSLGPGLDTNPTRTVGEDSVLDGFLGLTASGRLKLTFGEGQVASGRYEMGLRQFFKTGSEDLAAQQAGLDWAMQLGRVVLGAEANGKWRVSRSHGRDYADLGTQLYADTFFLKQLSGRLTLGARGFLYPPAWETGEATGDAEAAYDWVGPQGSAVLRWQPARQHTAALALFGALPYYRGWSRYEGSADFANGDDGLPAVRRRDAQFGGQVSYAYRGPVAVQAGYSYVRINSTSYGEASERHRLWAAAAAKLPLRLFASVQAAWQFIRYPDGVFLSQDLLLLDDESQSSVGAKLAYAAADGLDVELRYAAYWIALPPVEGEPGLTWWRHTAYLGFTFRL